MANKLTDREDGNQSNVEDLHGLLINVMREEFPDNPLYANGKTYVSQTNTEKKEPILVSVKDLNLSNRDVNQKLDLNAEQVTYAKYKINKMLPTIDDDDLDELLEDEWEFYVDPDSISAPRVDGLFLINKEVNLNPPDFHNEYIKRGPATIDDRMAKYDNPDDVVKTTFCVFFIQNSAALPIPNYKTLEVMLVERNKTYSDIKEATVEQTREFDLEIDGKFTQDEDGEIDPVEEFRFRQVLDRTTSWNPRVRFASGYVPGQDENAVQFQRDPGDYLIVPEMRFDGFYDQLVYQKQTYREKLRAKFEGKLIALQWTIPYNEAGIENGTPNVLSDDKVFLIRMMINGYWKQVISSNVLREYAIINNIDLSGIGYLSRSDFETILNTGGTLQTGFLRGGLYGADGLINTIISNGGMTVFQDDNVLDGDIKEQTDAIKAFYELIFNYVYGRVPIPGDPLFPQFNKIITDYSNAIAGEAKSPGWTDFSHIAEVDRLEPQEYEDYLNKYNNGGDPFEVDYLKPYEPPGSIAYYPKENVSILRAQAAAQAAVDSIKKDIMELLPRLSSRAAELDQRFSAAPANYLNYANTSLGPGGDIYKIMFSNDKFKFLKQKGRRRKGKFKQKQSEGSFMRLAEKADRLFLKMSKNAEDDMFYIPSRRDFTRLIKQDDEILLKLTEYLNTGRKKLFTAPDMENAVPGGSAAVQAAVAGTGAAVVGVGITTGLAVGAGIGGGLAGAAGVGIATAALPLAAGVAVAAGVAAGVKSLVLDVDLTPRGQPFRHGMPRGQAGNRQRKLLKKISYIKVIIGTYIYLEFVRKEVSGLSDANGQSVDLFDKCIAIDDSFFATRQLVDQSLQDIADIDNRVINSNTVGQFRQILTDLENIEQEFDDIDLELFEQGESLRVQIDDIVKYMIKQQYDCVEYARGKLNRANDRFFFTWPNDVREVIESYFPGKNFKSNQPGQYED